MPGHACHILSVVLIHITTRQKLRPTPGENRQTDGGAHLPYQKGDGWCVVYYPTEISSPRASPAVGWGRISWFPPREEKIPRWVGLKVPGDTMVFWWSRRRPIPTPTMPTTVGRMDMAIARYTELYGGVPEAEIVGKLAMVNDLETDD
jgi:hypothetical protein